LVLSCVCCSCSRCFSQSSFASRDLHSFPTRRSSDLIKLTIFARRREIEIMRLVGASNWFIRWPFFIEGALIGMLGAVFPVIIVLAFYKAALNVLTDGSQYSFIKMLPMMPLSLYVALLTTFLGVLIGVWGSVISIRRFLKV